VDLFKIALSAVLLGSFHMVCLPHWENRTPRYGRPSVGISTLLLLLALLKTAPFGTRTSNMTVFVIPFLSVLHRFLYTKRRN